MDDEARVALVLETHNLRGADADEATIVASLSRLLAHLAKQTYGLAKLAQLVITHDGPLEKHGDTLSSAAGRAVSLVALTAKDDYYAGKNRGFAATDADVVVFADSDCWPDLGWLAALVAPLREEGVQVAAGRTTYREGLLGAAATTIDFMYFTDGARWTKNFYANNVAFSRAVFEAHPFPAGPDLYRGNCQLLGMQLAEAGVKVRFVPAARTIHRFPDRLSELVKLRLLRGRDLVRIASPIVEAHTPLGAQPPAVASPLVWAGRAACSLASIGKQDMAPVGRMKSALVPAAVVGLSALDGLGALGVGHAVHRRTKALGYHGDRDQLR